MEKNTLKLVLAGLGFCLAIGIAVFFMNRQSAELARSEATPSPEQYLQEQNSRSGGGSGQPSEAELRQQRPDGK